MTNTILDSLLKQFSHHPSEDLLRALNTQFQSLSLSPYDKTLYRRRLFEIIQGSKPAHVMVPHDLGTCANIHDLMDHTYKSTLGITCQPILMVSPPTILEDISDQKYTIIADGLIKICRCVNMAITIESRQDSHIIILDCDCLTLTFIGDARLSTAIIRRSKDLRFDGLHTRQLRLDNCANCMISGTSTFRPSLENCGNITLESTFPSELNNPFEF